MKGDWDMEMALDILDMAPKLDDVVLVSGGRRLHVARPACEEHGPAGRGGRVPETHREVPVGGGPTGSTRSTGER
jgi:hypothetical protein